MLETYEWELVKALQKVSTLAGNFGLNYSTNNKSKKFSKSKISLLAALWLGLWPGISLLVASHQSARSIFRGYCQESVCS